RKYKGTRIKRGLFRTFNGKIINADVNAAYNIIKKAVPKAFDKVDGIEAFGVTPVSVRIE
ncbi:MAG: RNA-guided endonuclease TnpB family protein, partial [Candidatus Helarchaeota archaeon]